MRNSERMAAVLAVVRDLPEPFTYRDARKMLPEQLRGIIDDKYLMAAMARFRDRSMLKTDCIGRRGEPTLHWRTQYFDAPELAPALKRRGYRGPRHLSEVERRWKEFRSHISVPEMA